MEDALLKKKLTWRDVEALVGIASELEDEMNSLGCPPWMLTPEGFYSEVLRRFKMSKGCN